jgi:hypothetical protein
MVEMASIVAAPILFILTLVFSHRLGRLISSIDSALWDRMKPGLYRDIAISREHRQRLGDFIRNREYESLNSQSITRLSQLVKWSNYGSVVTFAFAVITVIHACIQ